jgi:hypothetical protein
VGSEDWLSPDRLRSLFRLIEAAPKELRLKIATKEFEADLITKGVFHRNDVWLAAFVVQEGASIVEFKVAIDRKNRVAYHRRVLVQGPAPPLSGAGVFTRAGNAAFAVAYPFLRNAIEESKKGRRP